MEKQAYEQKAERKKPQSGYLSDCLQKTYTNIRCTHKYQGQISADNTSVSIFPNFEISYNQV